MSSQPVHMGIAGLFIPFIRALLQHHICDWHFGNQPAEGLCDNQPGERFRVDRFFLDCLGTKTMYGINACKRLVKDRANDSEHPQYNKAALNA